MVSRAQLLAGIISILLIGSAITLLVLLPDQQPPPLPPKKEEPIRIIDMTAELNQQKSTFYKGEPINITIDVTVNDTVTIDSVYVYAKDIGNNRIGYQIQKIGTNITAGNSHFNLSLSPSFFYGQAFAVNVYSTYQLTAYVFQYTTNAKQNQTFSSFDSNPVFQAIPYPEFDQFPSVEMDVKENLNTTYVRNGSVLNFSTTDPDAYISLNTTIQTTAYARINYSLSGNPISAYATVGNKNYPMITGEYYIPIGIYNGIQPFSLKINLTQSSSLSLNISIITRKIPVFAVMASNHWSNYGDEKLYFEEPSFYLDQINPRYEKALNITFINAGTVYYDYLNSSTHLDDYLYYSLSAVGSSLDLGGNWTYKTGTAVENAGFDTLFLFSNKTMDAIGVVYGLYGYALNIAIQVRGSLYTGGQIDVIRLSPQFADNLLQHEVAHVFGADDRYLPISPPSVMTKSHPEDVLAHIATGEFWLLHTNWLEIDLQIMWVQRNLYG